MKYTFAVKKETKQIGFVIDDENNSTSITFEIEFFESENSRIALVDAYYDGTYEYKALTDHKEAYKKDTSFFDTSISTERATYNVEIAMGDSYYVKVSC